MTEFPTALSQLKKLKILDLSYNKLTSLPGSIERMEKLRYLNISRNEFLDPKKLAPEFFHNAPNLLRIYTDTPNLIPEFVKNKEKSLIINTDKFYNLDSQINKGFPIRYTLIDSWNRSQIDRNNIS